MINGYIVVLLLIITSCYSKIQINIRTASNIRKSVITHSGSGDKLVTEKEINAFNISDSNLKRGVRVELGKYPQDVFIKDPTRYGNLYPKYNWSQVTTNVRVKRAQVTEIVSENATLKRHNIVNNTSGRIVKKVSLKEVVEHTVSSSWSDEGLSELDVSYHVNMIYDGGSFKYENKWRNNVFQSSSFLFGVPNIGDILIAPGQSVTIELKAMKIIMLVKIEFAAKLIGNVIANYALNYGKHHLWAPSVDDIMKAAKLKNEIVTTEFLEIRCYVEPYLKLFDTNTLMPVHTINPFYVKRTQKKKKT
ncbi:U-megalopygitoxin(8)-Mc8-like [Epargyreus clarus]|uniref:U-megalopygitoxin(8)-Mc8-like n=1 Tax=Epargyreus clarus TaxID=520877 RepID=UPI003C2EA115